MIKTFKNPCITLRGPNVFKGLLMKHLIVNTLRGLDKKNEVPTYLHEEQVLSGAKKIVLVSLFSK